LGEGKVYRGRWTATSDRRKKKRGLNAEVAEIGAQSSLRKETQERSQEWPATGFLKVRYDAVS
jgi:hypothetical protein